MSSIAANTGLPSMEERNKQESLSCKVATTEKTNVCASPRARLTRATSVSAVMCSRPFELWADTCRGNMLNKNPLQSFASRRDLTSLCDAAEEEQGPTTPLPEDPQDEGAGAYGYFVVQDQDQGLDSAQGGQPGKGTWIGMRRQPKLAFRRITERVVKCGPLSPRRFMARLHDSPALHHHLLNHAMSRHRAATHTPHAFMRRSAAIRPGTQPPPEYAGPESFASSYEVESMVPCTPAPSPSDKESVEAHPPVEATGTTTSVQHADKQAGHVTLDVAVHAAAAGKCPVPSTSPPEKQVRCCTAMRGWLARVLGCMLSPLRCLLQLFTSCHVATPSKPTIQPPEDISVHTFVSEV